MPITKNLTKGRTLLNTISTKTNLVNSPNHSVHLIMSKALENLANIIPNTFFRKDIKNQDHLLVFKYGMLESYSGMIRQMTHIEPENSLEVLHSSCFR